MAKRTPEEIAATLKRIRDELSEPRPWRIRFDEAERRKEEVRRTLYRSGWQFGGFGTVRNWMRRYGPVRHV